MNLMQTKPKWINLTTGDDVITQDSFQPNPRWRIKIREKLQDVKNRETEAIIDLSLSW